MLILLFQLGKWYAYFLGTFVDWIKPELQWHVTLFYSFFWGWTISSDSTAFGELYVWMNVAVKTGQISSAHVAFITQWIRCAWMQRGHSMSIHTFLCNLGFQVLITMQNIKIVSSSVFVNYYTSAPVSRLLNHGLHTNTYTNIMYYIILCPLKRCILSLDMRLLDDRV